MNGQHFTATEEYPDLENNNSSMAHCLTEEIYEKLRGVETSTGVTIDEVIQPGVDSPGDQYDMTIGCLAGDAESYQVFAEFFDSVIEARHYGYKKTDRHVTKIDFEQAEDYCPNPSVLRCQAKGKRNVQGFCLPSHCTRAERRKVEKLTKEACLKLTGAYKGSYIQAKDITKEQCPVIMDDLRVQLSPSICFPLCMSRDWPDARGVFVNEQGNFAVIVNFKDHLEIVSLQSDGNFRDAFLRWRDGTNQLERHLQEGGNAFMVTEHLGYITTCPGNLGTGLKITSRLSLPRLLAHPRIEEILRRLRLGKRRDSENTLNQSSVELFNTECLGLGEVEILQSVENSAHFLCACEDKLEKNGSIEKDVNRLKHK